MVDKEGQHGKGPGLPREERVRLTTKNTGRKALTVCEGIIEQMCFYVKEGKGGMFSWIVGGGAADQ
jgi:hypothetical protein